MHKKLRVYIKPLRGILAFAIVLGMLGAIATIFQMTLLSGVVNAVFLSHKRRMLVLLPGVLILRASLLWGREVTAQRAAILLKASLRERVFAHLLRLGPTWSSGERTGELAAVVNEGIERLDASISRYLPQLVLSIVVPLLIIVVISLVDWFSAVLLLVTGPIIPLLMFLVGSYTEKRIQAQWATLSRMSAHFLDVMQGLTTLKLFGRSQAQQERIARVSDRFRDKTLQVLRCAFLVLLLTPEFYRPLQELGVQRHAAMEGEAAAKRIFEILEAPLPIAVEAAIDKPIPTGALTIDITDLSYTYRGKERYALNHISLSLPASTCTALVGRSGAGKSTLVNLLMRFMDTQSGRITVNGISFTDLPVEAWREYVALVPQRPYLFYGSVSANIRLARPGAGDDEVVRAAEFAGATEFINRLPQGYATEIGERGTRLSAGQAQRIAISRAFLKDAPLLVLDEPTSSLDPESEMLIRHALERLMHDRTVLVIAHRRNTIANAEQIIVLENGQLVEVGSHAELLRPGGPYAGLVSACPAPIQAALSAPQTGLPVPRIYLQSGSLQGERGVDSV